MTFQFGPDAFRDNERERALLSDAIERLEAGDDLSDLTQGELERIAQAGKAPGSNKAAVQAGERAQSLLDNEAEKEEERRFSEYWGGGITGEDRERQQLREAGRIR